MPAALLGFRLWRLNAHILPQQLRHSVLSVFHLVVDAALLYTLTLLVTLICLLVNTNAIAIMINLVGTHPYIPTSASLSGTRAYPNLIILRNLTPLFTLQTVPLVAITFYGVIIRVGMTRSSPSTFETTTDGNGILSSVFYLQPTRTRPMSKGDVDHPNYQPHDHRPNSHHEHERNAGSSQAGLHEY